MDRYAVFGHPISHSRSPDIHARFAAQTRQSMEYRAMDVPAEAFEPSLKNFIKEGGRGLNCTVPLKEIAFRISDVLSDRARRSGAVNTLKVLENDELLGENTDGIGLYRDLTQNLGLSLKEKRILILGAGGATRGILEPLLDAKPESLWIANRTVERAERLVSDFKPLGPIRAVGFPDLAGFAFDLILNATSASLTGELPLFQRICLHRRGVATTWPMARRPPLLSFGDGSKVPSSVQMALACLWNKPPKHSRFGVGFIPKPDP